MMTKISPAQWRQEQHKKGFTLTEIAIVLGIMGLVLGAIWVAAAGVYNNQRVNNATTSVMQVAQGVRALYSTTSSTGYGAATDMTVPLINANAVPNNLINAARTALVGPFTGGATAVISASDGNGFVLAMSAVPKSACISLLSAVGGTGRDPGLYMADAIPNAAPATSDATTTGTALTTTVTPNVAADPRVAGVSSYGGCTNDTNKVRFGFAIK